MREPAVGPGSAPRHGATIRAGFLIVVEVHGCLSPIRHGTVAGVWAFQGSRPFVYRNRLYNCMGTFVQCLDPLSGNIIWKTKVVDGNQQLLDHVLTPPVLVNGKVIVGTSFGDVACLSAKSGAWLWREVVGEPITFQLAVAKGRVYVPTATGSLFCLETGDAKDDGWFMWGGTAAHNGKQNR